MRRGAVQLHPTVLAGTTLRAGYRAEEIRFTGDNAIAHDWAPNYRVLLEKHRRYLRLEGPDRHKRGLVSSYRDIVATPWRSFSESFFAKEGFRDGMTGFALSLFWAFYSTGAKIAFLRELRHAAAGPS